MSDITVSTSSDFDAAGNLGLANGDNITIDTGAVLKVTSDVRWGQNAAVIGNVTVSSTSGGEFWIDGTAVWWIPFDAGTSTIPAIGATVTGATSGATGELIGTFTAYGVAPSAAGGATPSTGYIKLRSKTGTFQDNENLQVSGVTFGVVNSASGGMRGWLHVVGEESQTITVPRLGTFRITGDWFVLETQTSGSRNQTIQLPWADYAPGVWIETSAASGTYDFWPNIQTGWNTTNISTDSRCKFVSISSGGLLRIGSDGTNNLGDIPSSGCNIRVPNILISSSNSTDWTANTFSATLGTRWETSTTNGGALIWDKAMGAGFYPNIFQAYSTSISNAAFFDQLSIIAIFSPLTLSECHVGLGNASAQPPFDLRQCFSPGNTVTNCKFVRAQATAGSHTVIGVSNIANFTWTNCWGICIGTRSSSGSGTINLAGANDCTFTDYHSYGMNITVASASNRLTFNDTIYSDLVIGSTTSSNAVNGFSLTNCTSITIDGLTFHSGVSNVHPYNSLVSASTAQTVKIRNIGTPSSRLDLGSANQTGLVLNNAGNNIDIRVQRVYVSNTRTGMSTDTNTNTGITYEHVWVDSGDAIGTNSTNVLMKGINANGTIQTSFTSIYGNHLWDAFTGTTSGKLGIFFNEKTSAEPSASTYTVVAGTPKFTATGSLKMTGASDEIVYEWPHFILGYTSFTNSAPTLTGTNTGNLTYQYDINTGSGYGGSWKTLNTTNLTAETITATTGFKLKVRITVNTANSSNALTGLQIHMTTDSTSQQTQYPLDAATATLTGVVVGSRYRLEVASTEALIAEGTAASSTVSASYSSDSFPFDIRVIVRKSSAAPRYKPYQLVVSFPSTGVSVPVSQETDEIAS